jgi:type II secretory pathway component GspD/PulD (secretin)
MSALSRTVAFAAAVLTAGFIFTAPLLADATADAKLTAAQAAAAANLQKHALERPLPELRLNGSSLSDVIDFLADSTGANFSVDWKALEAARVSKDTPVTLRLSAVPLRKALQLILQQAGGAGVLTYYVDEGVIQVTSMEQADKEMVTRMYGIQDLLFEAQDHTNAPSLDITQASQGQQGGRGGGGSSGQSIFQNGNTSQTANTARSRDQRAQEIIKLITDTVRPEIWQVNGGTATISYIRGNLVVTAPRSVQEQLSSQ